MSTISRYNPSITGPDGRTYRGQYAHTLSAKNGESPWIAALARQIGGIAEVVLPAGRADVATDSHVYEVEPVKSWRHGARQAFAYSGMTGLSPALALFGKADYVQIYVTVRDRMPGLDLWVWRFHQWDHVTSRVRAAGRMGLDTRPPWPPRTTPPPEAVELLSRLRSRLAG